MERWSSSAGFLLAAIGSAVGIGNIWRFSAVMGQNGGGAYLIPYLIAVFLFALPLMILELALGQKFRGTIVSAFRQVHPRFNVIGWLLCAIVFLVLSYYLVVTGWTLAYSVLSLAGETLSFSGFTGSYLPVLSFIAATLLTGLIVSFGIQNGIERISVILIPACVITLIVLALYGTMLPGFMTGVRYLFTPDFSVLSHPLIWSAAFGQAFFSLSVGEGILLTYGTYLGSGKHIPGFALIITLVDLGVAVLAGLVIFPIVFSFGLAPSAGAELAFTSLPISFARIPGGGLVAVAFFIVLFFAALTSAVSMLEVSVAAVCESQGWPRIRAVAAVTLALIAAGLPCALSYSAAGWTLGGVRVLDFMDETVGTLGLPIAAVLLAGGFTWFLSRETLETALGGRTRLVRLIIVLCRYVIPTVLISTTLARVISGFDFPGTHIIPGVTSIGSLFQIEGMLAILLILLAVIGIACWTKTCRLPGWIRAKK